MRYSLFISILPKRRLPIPFKTSMTMTALPPEQRQLFLYIWGSSVPMKAITCLIIDDDEHARDRLESLLKMHKEIEVLAKIGDPNEGVKEIIYHEPALVFIDVKMRRTSGLDVV